MDTKICIKCKHPKSVELFSLKSNGKLNKVCNLCIGKLLSKYNERKNNKYCAKCGSKIRSKNRLLCKKCLMEARENQKNKRLKAHEEGKCIICMIRDILPGHSKCLRCIKRYRLPIITKLYRNARSRAKKSDIEFTIKEDDIIIPEVCPILNIKLTENEGTSGPNSYSLDRIDNSKGYISGNIQVISMRANQIKNDSTIDELELLIKYLRLIKR